MKFLGLYEIIDRAERYKRRKLDLTNKYDLWYLSTYVSGEISKRETRIYLLEKELQRLKKI